MENLVRLLAKYLLRFSKNLDFKPNLFTSEQINMCQNKLEHLLQTILERMLQHRCCRNLPNICFEFCINKRLIDEGQISGVNFRVEVVVDVAAELII